MLSVKESVCLLSVQSLKSECYVVCERNVNDAQWTPDRDSKE